MSSIFAERMKSARKRRGYSLEDLARQLERKGFVISRQALHKYEKGLVMPDSEMLMRLADALEVHPGYFSREMQVELGEIEFRKLNKLSAKEESRIIEEVKDHLSRYLELEEIVGSNAPFENPVMDMQVKNGEDVEAAAGKVRGAWRLGDAPIANVLEWLEEYHIKIVEVIETGDALDGMQTCIRDQQIPVIVINTHKIKSDDRKRFTALHELAHLLLPIEHLPEKEKEELCNRFAAAMLLPKTSALKELGMKRSKLLIQELGVLKQQYGISIQAIVMRAKDLGIISESYCKQFFFMLKQMGWKIEEPVKYEGNEKSGRFDQLLFRALAEDMISMSKAASLKNMKLAEFRSLHMIPG